MRLTNALVRVAIVLMADPEVEHWGYDLGKRAGVRSGVLYPMLSRMLQEEWLVDGWEDLSNGANGRPPRRYYRLTDRGRVALGARLEAARTDPRFSGLRLGWA